MMNKIFGGAGVIRTSSKDDFIDIKTSLTNDFSSNNLILKKYFSWKF